MFKSSALILMSCLHLQLIAATTPWIAYYNDKAPAAAFKPYNPIVFEIDSYPRLQPLLEEKKEVLGYVNLGEVDQHTPQFEKARQAGLMISENPDWPGSVAVDIRNPVWKKMLIEEIIPDIFSKGFVGLFLDQIDVPLLLEEENPKKYAGMTTAANELIKAIRKAFPSKKIMLNRGYEILPEVGNDIDYFLAESLYSEYNFQTKKYFVLSKEDNQYQLDYIEAARKQFPHLVFFSLDYWDPKDTDMYKKIYSIERSHGLRPYVSTINLDKIIPEPS